MGASQREQGGGIMTEFNDWIVDLEVEDMPSVGHKYTWYRLKSGWIGFLCLLNHTD